MNGCNRWNEQGLRYLICCRTSGKSNTSHFLQTSINRSQWTSHIRILRKRYQLWWKDSNFIFASNRNTVEHQSGPFVPRGLVIDQNSTDGLPAAEISNSDGIASRWDRPSFATKLPRKHPPIIQADCPLNRRWSKLMRSITLQNDRKQLARKCTFCKFDHYFDQRTLNPRFSARCLYVNEKRR